MSVPQSVVSRTVNEPIRFLRTVSERFDGPDRGLICSWEEGRRLHHSSDELSAAAKRGELPLLCWRGGVDASLVEKTKKFGTFLYLAQWQGLRNEDLYIDTDGTVELRCSKWGVLVTFNNDGAKPKKKSLKPARETLIDLSVEN